MMDVRGKVVSGRFLHAPTRDAVEILTEALVDIDAAGTIRSVTRTADPQHAQLAASAARENRLVTLPPKTAMLPGFIDLHIHAPQYPQLGKALDVPLEVWLQRYTFPLEARYADLAFARKSYEALVGDLLAGGTTTALYFATIHQEATRLLAEICLAKGQRALVGKVAMDHPEACPPNYRDQSARAAIEGTAALIDHLATLSGNDGRVRAVATPRFIPACTDALLEGLGALVKSCGCHVQTHCSESDWEHGAVLARHGATDAEMLDRFGLLTRRTILAHSNFLTGADMDRVAARGAGVAHCPLSNAYFANAVFPLRAALAKGVRVGLGTDISGGPSASMLEVQRMAIAASRMLEGGVDPDLPAERRGRPGARIDVPLAFHLATAGGADALDLPVGSFAAGRQFDAILVDPEAPGSTMRLFEEVDEEADLLEKIVYTASRPNLAKVFVAGRAVSGSMPDRLQA